jgi:hypothetical protein
MLKTAKIELTGRDAGHSLTITELPALVADRLARGVLREIGADPNGGIVSLAMRHLQDVRKLGPRGLELLTPFVNVGAPLATLVRDFRNIERVQQAALLLHVGFLVGRQATEVPVTMRAEQLLAAVPDVSVTFCSPFIAAVIESDKASYTELETVLSTEDAFNIVEILNVRAVLDWHEHQKAQT